MGLYVALVTRVPWVPPREGCDCSGEWCTAEVCLRDECEFDFSFSKTKRKLSRLYPSVQLRPSATVFPYRHLQYIFCCYFSHIRSRYYSTYS